VRIVAEVPADEAEGFWAAGHGVKSEILSAFEQTGVEAVVAKKIPANALDSGWERIGTTKYYAYVFKEAMAE
jgi:hypothetical protein